jgi:hypothetical protein
MSLTIVKPNVQLCSKVERDFVGCDAPQKINKGLNLLSQFVLGMNCAYARLVEHG